MYGPVLVYYFFFQAEDGIRDLTVTGVQTCFFLKEEDGIRDLTVTGVQTCALPISDGIEDAIVVDEDLEAVRVSGDPVDHVAAVGRARGTHARRVDVR